MTEVELTQEQLNIIEQAKADAIESAKKESDSEPTPASKGEIFNLNRKFLDAQRVIIDKNAVMEGEIVVGSSKFLFNYKLLNMKTVGNFVDSEGGGVKTDFIIEFLSSTLFDSEEGRLFTSDEIIDLFGSNIKLGMEVAKYILDDCGLTDVGSDKIKSFR